MKEKTIKYYSTNAKASKVTFREALLKGLAPDGGLYMPDSIPHLSSNELESLSEMQYYEIAQFILNKFLDKEINKDDLSKICTEAYDFDVPIERVIDRNYILRLDQGPTASFKDFAARMMSRLMQYFLASEKRHLTILTATSGDTGSAVANAFFDQPNIRVIILFPKNEVTDMQRKQMTTLHKNISVISIDGKFDDCQTLVKRAFLDADLSGINLSSANSINIGRLLPQSVYYFYAWSKLAVTIADRPVFSVPSGNFGNLMGGILAREMGLPVERFIISTNSNDEVPEYLKTGAYKKIIPSKNCISSAMNVGHPSNLARIVAIYNGVMDETGNITKVPDLDRMRHDFFAISASDGTTKRTISDIYRKHGILLEPHGAIAWHGLREFHKSYKKKKKSQLSIALETAHPAKFPDDLLEITNVMPLLPSSLKGISAKEEKYISMENSYEALKQTILGYI